MGHDTLNQYLETLLKERKIIKPSSCCDQQYECGYDQALVDINELILEGKFDGR